MRDFSANGGQPVGNNIVPDGMGEGDRLAVTDGYDINAATLKLVEECLVVIGTHTCPAGITDLMIKFAY